MSTSTYERETRGKKIICNMSIQNNTYKYGEEIKQEGNVKYTLTSLN